MSNQQIKIIGSPTLAMYYFIENGGRNVEGMVVAAPWAWDKTTSQQQQKLFQESSLQQWKAPVNWRSAMSYDATMTIVEALKQLDQNILSSNNQQQKREQLAQKLSAKDFSFNGATGKIQFQDIRDSRIHLLEIKKSQSGERLEFSVLPRDATMNRCDSGNLSNQK